MKVVLVISLVIASPMFAFEPCKIITSLSCKGSSYHFHLNGKQNSGTLVAPGKNLVSLPCDYRIHDPSTDAYVYPRQAYTCHDKTTEPFSQVIVSVFCKSEKELFISVVDKVQGRNFSGYLPCIRR